MPIFEVTRRVLAPTMDVALGASGPAVKVEIVAPWPGEEENLAARAPTVRQPTTAEIKASVTPDFITSFEDGKLYRTLKRHVAKHGMTLAEYRTKWGLPSDYPSVAPGYSAKRSELAKAAGLGRK